jgi:mycothiol synthase
VNLPDGLRARPLTPDDVDETISMVNACERFDSGELMWERADLLADISIDRFDRDADWLGVFAGERIVAWAFLQPPRSAYIDVAPDVRGRGIGSALLSWAIERAKERGNIRLGQTIDDTRTDVGTFLRANGFTARHTSWMLRIDHPQEPPVPRLPEGIEIRPIDLPGEEIQTLQIFEDAFSDLDDRVALPLDYWRSTTIEREGFAPADLLVAVDDDRVIGAAFLIESNEIWVDKLAVASTHRNRGVARAILGTAFRRSFDLGYDHTSLATDSRTGALTLYERIGMRVTRSFTHWAIDLSRVRRWPRDSNPRESCPSTRFPGVSLRPLGQATGQESTEPPGRP